MFIIALRAGSLSYRSDGADDVLVVGVEGIYRACAADRFAL